MWIIEVSPILAARLTPLSPAHSDSDVVTPERLCRRQHDYVRSQPRSYVSHATARMDLPDRPVPYYYKGTWGPPPAHAPADGWHDMALRT